MTTRHRIRIYVLILRTSMDVNKLYGIASYRRHSKQVGRYVGAHNVRNSIADIRMWVYRSLAHSTATAVLRTYGTYVWA